MGTTTQGETYSLKLRGIGREILIIDTPGILEAGIAGTEREDEFVRSFVQDAISKVVQPLSEAWGDEDLEEEEEAQVVSEMVAQLEDDW